MHDGKIYLQNLWLIRTINPILIWWLVHRLMYCQLIVMDSRHIWCILSWGYPSLSMGYCNGYPLWCGFHTCKTHSLPVSYLHEGTYIPFDLHRLFVLLYVTFPWMQPCVISSMCSHHRIVKLQSRDDLYCIVKNRRVIAKWGTDFIWHSQQLTTHHLIILWVPYTVDVLNKLIQIFLTIVHRNAISIKTSIGSHMCDRPLSEPMMDHDYRTIFASLGLN